MTEQKHTPLPWEVSRHGHTVEVVADDAEVRPVVSWMGFDDSDRPPGEHLANAEFIVRAVNSHDALVAACEAARKALVHANTNAAGMQMAMYEAEIEQLESALRIAKGET